MPRFDDSVTTEFADFPTSAWRTIPRRFLRKKRQETDFYSCYDHNDRKYEKIEMHRKCLTKKNRLNSATVWIKGYNGKNIISGYAKWFGVDKICAIKELKTLGVVIPENLENQIICSLKLNREQKLKNLEKKKLSETISVESDDNFAFIVGYTTGGVPFGLTHEEMNQIETENTD